MKCMYTHTHTECRRRRWRGRGRRRGGRRRRNPECRGQEIDRSAAEELAVGRRVDAGKADERVWREGVEESAREVEETVQ
jgi:hypothetical protein